MIHRLSLTVNRRGTRTPQNYYNYVNMSIEQYRKGYPRDGDDILF
ncbi:unnamed protein product [Acanthoscelides obtectus]|uniref:Uncharacterized protein n=1 Tax=Acanthoscelides obtectus TaxID=200917 RepID=A0A9P0JYS2_ACAOB|nr:unnamed protein product [Acanthoscelides obtectus]CAK1663952.1 hypothetical protein AOBTE_LOCUS23955 [Acanthoscelides obtectus]